ncbi:MAG: hypothetical protein N3A54_01055 [Patescibacteria group bacterium]|nr:hypothetical protein [Patescibacteria group bacterium]
MRLELRKDGKLVNIIEADLEWAQENFPDCEIIEAPLPEINFESQIPEIPPHILERKYKMTKYQFRKRFTIDELLRFDNPEAFIQNITPQHILIIKTLKNSYNDATEIDLRDEMLQYGLQLMVDWGLLSEERKQQILDPDWNPSTPSNSP